MSPDKPLASISLDADDLWSYLRTRGDPAWERFPSYLPRFFPRVLDLLDEVGLRLTFFLVGLDAARDENRASLSQLVPRGHEVGNHSHRHECWLERYSRDALVEEVEEAERAIEAATGTRPRGFRGPGFSWAPALLDVLAERGYRYDASTFPTFIGPLARWYFLASTRLRGAERKQREALFGGLREGFRPNRPYYWLLPGDRRLLEIPVTTIPGVRLPFHLSYLLYLRQRSEGLMHAYLKTAVRACRWARVEPSVLLHPLDILGADEVHGLEFFPAMRLSSRVKAATFVAVLRTLAKHFRLVPVGAHAEAIMARQDIRQVAVPRSAPLVPDAGVAT